MARPKKVRPKSIEINLDLNHPLSNPFLAEKLDYFTNCYDYEYYGTNLSKVCSALYRRWLFMNCMSNVPGIYAVNINKLSRIYNIELKPNRQLFTINEVVDSLLELVTYKKFNIQLNINHIANTKMYCDISEGLYITELKYAISYYESKLVKFNRLQKMYITDKERFRLAGLTTNLQSKFKDLITPNN